MPNRNYRRSQGHQQTFATESSSFRFSFGEPAVFSFGASSAPVAVDHSSTKTMPEKGTSCLPRVGDFLQQTLAQERNDLQFTDLTVSVEGTDYHCHRLVLAAISGFFRSLLSSGMKEATERKVKLHGISCSVYTQIMNWIYEGDLTLTFDNVFELFAATDQLDIAPLKTECLEFLTEKISHENCVRIYQMSNMYNCADLKERSWDYLLHNFDSVCSTEEICKLSIDDVRQLISDSELVTNSEDKVLETVLKWAGYAMSPCSLEHATAGDNDEHLLKDTVNDTESFHGDRSPQTDNERQDQVLPTEVMVRDGKEVKDPREDDHSKTNQTLLELIEKQPGKVNTPEIKSPTRVVSLASLLEATRYLLVSSNYMWKHLANDERMRADQRCLDILEEILHHKTELDKHQSEWRLAETHRKTGPLRDVILAKIDGSLWCKLNWDNSWRNASLKADLNSATHLAYYDKSIYYRNADTTLYVLMPGYNTSLCIIGQGYNNINTVAMFPVGNELISIYKKGNKAIHYVESACLASTNVQDWNQVGQLFTSGMEVASVTNIDQRLIVFWKKGGQSYLSVECFDLSQQKSFLLPDQLSSSDGLVTFKHGDEAFALQQNGALWRVSDQDEAPFISLKLELWLWNFHRVVNGAMVVCRELWVFEPTTKGKKETSIQTEGFTAKLDGVFEQVRFCSGASQSGFIHAVLPKSVIGN